MAELNSCIPFSGGSYGFVRIAISPMLGYLVGCCDRLHAGLLFGRSMLMIGKVITTVTVGDVLDTVHVPLYWLGIAGCGMVLFFLLWRIDRFWQVMSLQAVVTMMLLGWFCVAVAQQEGFAHRVYGGTSWMMTTSSVAGSSSSVVVVDDDGWIGRDSTGVQALLRCFPMAMLLFSGLEVLPCVAGAVSDVSYHCYSPPYHLLLYHSPA